MSLSLSHTLPLTIRPARGASSVVVGAAFVPGGDAREWLREAAGWGAQGREARFLVLPGSQGALILPGRVQGGAAAAWRPSRRAIPCVLWQGCLWMPAGAEPYPAPLTEEMARLFPQAVNFLHPSLGLCGWEESDARRAAAFIVRPGSQGASWEMSVAGPAPGPELKHITLQLPESFAFDFLEVTKGDIGSGSPQDLKPRKPSASLIWKDRLARWLTGPLRPGVLLAILAAVFGLIGILALITGKASGGPVPFALLLIILLFVLSRQKSPARHAIPPPLPGTGPSEPRPGAAPGAAPGPAGFLNHLRDWARRQTQALQEAQQNELERLMRLLKDDPEKGLRYALPLDNGEAARGYAPVSGTQLTLRNPVLGGGDGGVATDSWNLDQATRWKLEQQYRDLAAEEAKAGRHERAAYIYGKLLGNWTLAARALMDGGHHLQAAHLYRTKLNSPPLAAECLQRAGHYVEAALIHTELRNHEAAGNCWARTGRPEEAFRAWMQAIRATRHRAEAARIIETRLNEPGWAAALLASGWPDSWEAMECLRAHFKLLAKCQATEEALVQVERLRREHARFSGRPSLYEFLAEFQSSTLDQRVKDKLTLVGRLVAASDLPGLAKGPRTHLMEKLGQFDPTDPLLRTDVRRYADRLTVAKAQAVRKRLAAPIKPAEVIPVSGKARLLDFVGRGRDWFLLDQEADGRVCLRTADRQHALMRAPETQGWLVMHPARSETRLALAGAPVEKGVQTQSPETGNQWLHRPLHFSAKLRALLPGVPGELYTLEQGESQMLDLTTYQWEGGVRQTRALGWTDSTQGASRLPASAWDQEVAFALGNSLYWIKLEGLAPETNMKACNLPDAVSHLSTGGRPGETRHLAVVTGSNVLFLSLGKDWEPVQLETGHSTPACTTFLPDGNLVVMGSHGGHLYDPRHPSTPLAELKLPDTEFMPRASIALETSTAAVLLESPSGERRVAIYRLVD